MKLKRFLSCFLIFACLFSLSVQADRIDEDVNETVNGKIVTEYYTDDILEDSSVESVATVPVTTPPEVDAKSVILMEASTGKVLHEKDSDVVLSPASITKIMTMLLVVEALDNGKISMNDSVPTSEHAASMGGSQIWLEAGETMTVENLLKAVAVGSANDASVALAEFIAGSEEAFVAQMNNRAKELGMTNTNFVNACGLDAEGHVTSARDVAIMSKELISHNTIKQFTTIWMDSLRGGETQLVNTNKLVRYYLGATGLKTGTTDEAGFCLSATAKRDGMELIAVVMGGASSDARFNGAKALLNYGFANWKIKTPEFDESSLQPIPVIKGKSETVNIEMEPIKSELLDSSGAEDITVQADISESVEAPVEKNEVVGTVKVMLGDKVLNEYKVYTTEKVEKINVSFLFSKLIQSLFAT